MTMSSYMFEDPRASHFKAFLAVHQYLAKVRLLMDSLDGGHALAGQATAPDFPVNQASQMLAYEYLRNNFLPPPLATPGTIPLPQVHNHAGFSNAHNAAALVVGGGGATHDVGGHNILESWRAAFRAQHEVKKQEVTTEVTSSTPDSAWHQAPVVPYRPAMPPRETPSVSSSASSTSCASSSSSSQRRSSPAVLAEKIVGGGIGGGSSSRLCKTERDVFENRHSDLYGSDFELNGKRFFFCNARRKAQQLYSYCPSRQSEQDSDQKRRKPKTIHCSSPYCSYSTDRMNNYKRHQNTMHSYSVDKEGSPGSRYRCCDLILADRGLHRLHNRLEHARGFECRLENCGKSFERKALLDRHELTHSPRRLYRCQFQPSCNYRSNHLSNVRRHFLNHCRRSEIKRNKNQSPFAAATVNVWSGEEAASSSYMSEDAEMMVLDRGYVITTEDDDQAVDTAETQEDVY